MLWFLLFLLLFLGILHAASFFTEQSASDFGFQELERNAVMMMDSLVKNRNAEKPQYGSALLDSEKKRVLENQLDSELLEQVPEGQESEQQPVFFKKIELEFEDHSKKTIFEIEQGENCLSVERFVLVENKKALVRGAVCRE